MKMVECIPNFSEGRDPEIIHAIADAIKSVPNVWLLHVDPGYDANRTVYTFVGEIDAIFEAAYQAIQVAAQKIDMSVHHGEHPRMGACDVCPFVPLGDTDLNEVVERTHLLGKRLGEDGIPVYMYEHSATTEKRRNLAYLRKGEYEALPQKMTQESWRPDYGPFYVNEKFGAMVLGARPFLIAYNVNLETDDVSIAKAIAKAIRESGNGHQSGKLKGVKAIGWWMEEYQCAQVSTNIVDIQQSDVKQVFDAVREEAALYHVEVKTSELIGLIPEKVIEDVGRKLNPLENDKHQLSQLAFEYLGLKHISDDRILERRIQQVMQ